MTSKRNNRITSADSFITAIESILVEAYRHDIDVEGGWFIQPNIDSVPGWDVEIWLVQRDDSEN
ncbi:hypothetical protein [Haladaptatus caseinilyticus]|uniref:hypothetical protein n=1 Tax=Haladaptatus caseinilyticus TaxID=2993314 RepID=UPI00224A724E|nr:hypothetical protein [Haladaptatus caseinilyticus]